MTPPTEQLSDVLGAADEQQDDVNATETNKEVDRKED